MVERALRPARSRASARPAADRDLARLEEELSDALGTTVAIHAGAKGKGQIRIDFSTLDQLQGLIDRLHS